MRKSTEQYLAYQKVTNWWPTHTSTTLVLLTPLLFVSGDIGPHERSSQHSWLRKACICPCRRSTFVHSYSDPTDYLRAVSPADSGNGTSPQPSAECAAPGPVSPSTSDVSDRRLSVARGTNGGSRLPGSDDDASAASAGGGAADDAAAPVAECESCSDERALPEVEAPVVPAPALAIVAGGRAACPSAGAALAATARWRA